MNYVLTGGAGHVTKPIALKLLSRGHKVTVIGRNAANLKELTDAGAIAAIGAIEDISFLTTTFKGADAVYTMVPPKYDAADWKEYIGSIGMNYATALKTAGVKYVVNLSSIGAHLPDGCGPVSGLYRAEQALDQSGLNIRHLRASYFYQNLLANLSLIKQAGIMGSNFSISGDKFSIVHPLDIADAVVEELLSLNFKGSSVRYVASDDVSTDGIAATIGAALGKSDLKWIAFPDDQALQGMLQAGLPEENAKNYVEMGQALNSGIMSEDYLKNHPDSMGKIKLADFAKEFAAAYHTG